MAVIRKIVMIIMIMLALMAIFGILPSYTNNRIVVCYPTLQRRVLEIIHPYIYGLSCGKENYFFSESEGILAWIWALIMKVWRMITASPEEEEYVCQLDWGLVNIRFSVAANCCTVIGDEDNWNQYYYNLALVLPLAVVVLGLCFLFYYHCSGRRNINDLGNEIHNEKPDDGDNKDKLKENKSESDKKVPKKITYRLIKEAYERKPASRGIADALPDTQKVVCHKNLEAKEGRQQHGLTGILQSTSVEHSHLKRKAVVVKERIEPRRKKTKQVLNWVLNNNIKFVKQLGEYTILRILGHGSFAKIYLAKATDQADLSKKDHQKEREADYVAIKIVDKEFLNRHRVSHNWKQTAVNELKIMEVSKCCPFLMYVNMAFQTTDYLVYVMPLMYGSLLDYKIPFSPRRLVLLAAEILSGLTHLHSLGYIHRDLKVDNVLIDESGHIKISDFGCSRGNVYGKKKCYGIVGNRRCQAPEVLQGRPYNESADFWSFGVLMYLLIEETYPFQDTKNRTRSYAMFVRHLLFQSATEEETDFIRGLFHHDPDQRLGSPSSQYGDIYAHEYFTGIDYRRLWAGGYEPPCPGMLNPVDSLSRYGSTFHGIPVRPNDDIPDEDLVMYADFPFVST